VNLCLKNGQCGAIRPIHFQPQTSVINRLAAGILPPKQNDCQLMLMPNQRRHNNKHNDTQNNYIQHEDTKHNDTQHNYIQHEEIKHKDIKHKDTQHNIT
jgi:hypothetical protein